jgi:16S rRNA (adenine1518-N6/adenine1519-N6)-dimethyltransferase
MMARPGEADYSSFSLLCGAAYRISPLISLKGASFYPEPRVESQGLRLDLREDCVFLNGAPVILKPLIRGLFASRRKTVKNNLQSFITSRLRAGDGTALAEEALARSGIAPAERAERLGLPEFIRIAESLEALPDWPSAGMPPLFRPPETPE